MKRMVLAIIAVLILACFMFVPAIIERRLNRLEDHAAYPVSDAAAALHERILIADMHADSLMWNRDLLSRGTRGHVDLPRLGQGNVALQVFTTVTKSPHGLNYEENAADALDDITMLAVVQRWPPRTWHSLSERALYQAARLERFAARAPDRLVRILDREDLAELRARRQRGERVVGAILGTEGSHALDGELANVDRLFAAGFRMMSLQHFFDNELGGSLHGKSKAGLSDFGVAAVARMLELGVIVDLAHSSPAVVADVLRLTDRPLVVSHSGIYSHCPGPRNVADELMREIAARGGLVGIGFWKEAVCDASPDGIAGAIAAAIVLLGEDAVALGSDFDGAVTTRFDVSELAALTEALMKRGLSPSQIAKVMGGNQFAFFEANLPAARRPSR